MEGLNVVDFPGVDDEDDSIGDLADLLITVAQIILFVVDYRYMIKIEYGSSGKTGDEARSSEYSYISLIRSP